MAISTETETRNLEAQTPLLQINDDVVDGYVDCKGFPVNRSRLGGWRSASFILGAGSIERFAYYGIETNLINYLTGQIGESTAAAAANVNTWVGVNWLVPILGAFVADSFLGRYGTVILTSILYILGLGSLTLLAILVSNSEGTTKKAPSTGSGLELHILLFFSLFLITVAQGYKPCVQALGADQFDGKHPEESRAKSSFFNWWFGGLCAGGVVTHLTLHYIQDNISWSIGFGIPCLSMIISLILFLLGTRTYRYAVRRRDKEGSQGSSSHQIAATVAIAEAEVQEAVGISPDRQSSQNKFINEVSPPTSSRMNKAKKVSRLLPIWAPCLTYAITYAQCSTLFTKQATTMDKTIGQNFEIPAASLRTFLPLSIILFVTFYDRVFIPIAGKITGKPSGITMLQRIGTGIAIFAITMVIAALIEKKRLETAEKYGLIDVPNATVPMSFWWLIPQYVLFGLADVFTLVGMQEFFYDQVPNEMRSVGLSLYLSAIGIGNFLSSFLISIIERATSQNGGRDGWFSDNLNRAHVDYFYWLLVGIDVVGLVAFIYFAKSYIYEKN